MTLFLLLVDAGLTVVAGAAVAGLARTPLRLLERCLIAVVTGVIAGGALTYALSLIAGLNTATVLGGPALVAVVALAVAVATGDPRVPWRESWQAERARWSALPVAAAARRAAAPVAVFAAALAIFTAIFAHTVFTGRDNSLQAGYPTVWADWSQHLTTAASFAIDHNLPPDNPLLSGTPLLYPFLPDFHAASLMTLGLSPGAALAIPGALLALVVAMLVVALAQRLGAGFTAGVIAAAICFLGGGLGFVGAFSDACTHNGFDASQCTLEAVITHPSTALQVIGGTIHDLPATVAAQPRAYDGLPSDGGPAPFPNMQWYTPLQAWWLPQRSILFGFAAAVSVLILVTSAWQEYSGRQQQDALQQQQAPRHRQWGAFALAGVLIGLLPLVHVQTMIALVLLLGVLAVFHRRREWLVLLGVATVLAAPRVVQLVVSPHGSATFGNAYPWLEPGWLANTGTAANPGGHIDMSVGGVFVALGQAIDQLVAPRWWGFWLLNLGIAVPLCVVVLLASVASLLPAGVSRVAARVTDLFPRPLLELFLGAMLIFAVGNVVVFQSWNWDNTKLLVYWYLVVGLLVAALVSRWWRGWWRRVAGVAMVSTMLLTGTLTTLRLLPWTPPDHSVTGPFTIASTDERRLATSVAATTPPGAVFLTFGRPNDPLLAVAGRTGVMGYYGWLWSYGVDFGTRYGDVLALYQGCATTPSSCQVVTLLRRYQIGYVEIDDRVNDPGAIQPRVDLTWWAAQGFPVVARSEHITVYDVRGVVG